MNSHITDRSDITYAQKSGIAIGDHPSSDGISISLADELAASEIKLPKRNEVEDYLSEHAGLRSILGPVCQRMRSEFGPHAELSLIVYRDPEIQDRYLTLYVRQRKYDSNIIDRIEQISAEFEAGVSASSGHLLISTDFH